LGELSVWAPHATNVDLVLEDDRRPMKQDRDWWRATIEPGDGLRYGFSLDGGPARFDPRGLRLPDGPHGLSAWFDPAGHAWADAGWGGVRLDEAVIYELHVGTFTPEGTLDAAVDRLDHLADLGVTLVELLPLASFPGRHGWGYDGVAPYSVHEVYGGPAALQRFVDAAHARGLGVCLDVVYNHLGPDGNHLPEFGPYLTDSHHTPWGQAVNFDAPGSDEVRSFVVDNVRQWFVDFHVDALRLDAVHELRDDRALHVLEEISTVTDRLAEQLGRPLWLVAESDRNDPRTVTARDEGGLGLHAQWADDVHHALHVLLTGESRGYFVDFADSAALAMVMRSPFLHVGTWSSFRGRSHGRPVDLSHTPPYRFVASLQTHDQVGNRAAGDRLSQRLAPGRLACGAALLLCSPWTPMLFMGEEWGAATPWQFFTDHTDPAIADATREGRRREFARHGWAERDVPDPQDPATFLRSKLDWDELTRSPHDRLLEWYRSLLRLRRERPELRAGPAATTHTSGAGTVVVRRGPLAVIANLSGAEQRIPTTGEVLLSWDPDARVQTGMVALGAESVVVVEG
jgi:maltooligosyltrehalose trehalohydrolase